MAQGNKKNSAKPLPGAKMRKTKNTSAFNKRKSEIKIQHLTMKN